MSIQRVSNAEHLNPLPLLVLSLTLLRVAKEAPSQEFQHDLSSYMKIIKANRFKALGYRIPVDPW